MLLVWAAVGCYESFLILYIVGIILILFLRGITGKDKLSLPYLLTWLGVGALTAVACILLRDGIRILLEAVFPIAQASPRSFSVTAAYYQDGEWANNIIMLAKRYWVVYFVNAIVYFPAFVYVVAVCCFAVIAITASVKKKNPWFPVLVAGMLIAPFLLTLIETKVTYYRSCQYLPFFSGLGIMLLFWYFADKKLSRYTLPLLAFCSILTVYKQAFQMNQNFYMDYRKYEHQRELLTAVALEVKKAYGEDATVIFTGDYEIPYEFVKDYYVDFHSKEFQWICRLTDWLDPYLKEKYYSDYGYCFAGEARYSLTEWGFTAFENPGKEIARLLEMHGYSINVISDFNTFLRAREYADNMPKWPLDGSIIEWEGYVLIHL